VVLFLTHWEEKFCHAHDSLPCGIGCFITQITMPHLGMKIAFGVRRIELLKADP
jgi:hypothetical protein